MTIDHPSIEAQLAELLEQLAKLESLRNESNFYHSDGRKERSMKKRRLLWRLAAPKAWLTVSVVQLVLIPLLVFAASSKAAQPPAKAMLSRFEHPCTLSCPFPGPPITCDTGIDAELLAMELSGALRPPPELYDQLYDDLTAIRQAFPDMNSICHRARWAPGELLVTLTAGAWEQFQSGNYHGLDDLNAQYGPVEITILASFMHLLSLQFEEWYNPEYLAPLYAAAEGVVSARPDLKLGDGSDIQVSLPVYTFKLGMDDCASGCEFEHFWVFEVSEGSVTLLDEYGSPLCGVWMRYLPAVHKRHSSAE